MYYYITEHLRALTNFMSALVTTSNSHGFVLVWFGFVSLSLCSLVSSVIFCSSAFCSASFFLFLLYSPVVSETELSFISEEIHFSKRLSKCSQNLCFII